MMNGDVGVLIRRQFDEIVIESAAHDLRGRFLRLGIERGRNLVRCLKFLHDDLLVLDERDTVECRCGERNVRR